MRMQVLGVMECWYFLLHAKEDLPPKYLGVGVKTGEVNMTQIIPSMIS